MRVGRNLRPLDGTLAVTADANRATGTYERKGYDQMTIKMGASTLTLGPPDSLGESFLASLAQVTGFAFDSRRLALIFPKSGNESFLMFEAAK